LNKYTTKDVEIDDYEEDNGEEFLKGIDIDDNSSYFE
jgi:hypothetical protein